MGAILKGATADLLRSIAPSCDEARSGKIYAKLHPISNSMQTEDTKFC